MNKVLLSCFFLLCALGVNGQDLQRYRSPQVEAELKRIGKLGQSHARESLFLLDSLTGITDNQKYPITIARIYLQRGKNHRFLGEMEASMESFTRAYQIFDSLGDKKGLTTALNSMAVGHMVMKNPATAREYLESALRLGGTISDTDLVQIYSNIGVTHDMEGKSELAITYYQKAIRSAERIKDSMTVANGYHGIGIAYANMQRFKECEFFELKALEAGKQIHSNLLICQVLGSMGSFYFEMKENEKGEKFLLEALDIGRREKYWNELQNCYLSLADYYRENDRAKEALALMDEYINLKDSIDNKNNQDMMADKEAKFRFDIQERALELTELKSENRLRWTFGLSLISVLLLVISFMFYRNYRLKQKANQLLTAEKAYIESERQYLKEENLILQKENLTAKFETLKNQINPHFLFNALNSLYALVETNPKSSQEFIRQFSLMYRKVLEFNDLPVVSLRQELDLVNHYLYLQKIRFGENLRVTIKIDAQAFNYFIPPFTIQMLLENAVKHNVVSADDPLSISIESDLDKAELRISNSLSSRKASDTGSTGTGLKNILRRYEILSDKTPEFRIDNNQYLATLPLLTEE